MNQPNTHIGQAKTGVADVLRSLRITFFDFLHEPEPGEPVGPLRFLWRVLFG